MKIKIEMAERTTWDRFADLGRNVKKQ